MKVLNDLYFKGAVMKERMVEAWQDEEGMGVIEIAIIIIVLIAIALAFRTKITGLVKDLLNSISVGDTTTEIKLD